MYENNIGEYDNLDNMMENQEIIADNRNIELTLGRQQRDKIVQYLFHRNGV